MGLVSFVVGLILFAQQYILWIKDERGVSVTLSSLVSGIMNSRFIGYFKYLYNTAPLSLLLICVGLLLFFYGRFRERFPA